jgi:aminocarboxymuconate-semialdehyde decarboxylase
MVPLLNNNCWFTHGIIEGNESVSVCLYFVLGGAFPFTVGRIEHGYNVRPDLCATNCDVGPRSFLGKFYTDSLVHDPVSLKLLIDVIGEVCTWELEKLRVLKQN